MSDNDRPDLAAFHELEQLIHALAEEMASWRRRAHEAESRLRTLSNGSGGSKGSSRSEAERENEELRRRLDSAQQRTKQLLDRLRFLRQQHELGADR